MYSSYEYEHDWSYEMVVEFAVPTNLGVGINLCMCLGVRLTALSLAPTDLEISTRILLLPDELKSVSRGVRKRENY